MINRNSLIPDTKTEPRAKGTSAYKNQSSRSQSFAKGNISDGTPNVSVKVITRKNC